MNKNFLKVQNTILEAKYCGKYADEKAKQKLDIPESLKVK